MRELAAQIKAKGYWQTKIRPLRYVPSRIADKLSILRFVGDLAVRVRGWDFPHVNPNRRPVIEEDSVGQSVEWECFRELWRVHLSGQFIHLGGIRYDWGEDRVLGLMEKPPADVAIIGAIDSLTRLGEIMEFASQYGHAIAAGEGVEVILEIGGLNGRHLVIDSRQMIGLRGDYVCEGTGPFARDVRVDDGMSGPDVAAVARLWARGLFERFGWRPGDAVLKEWQSRVGNL